MQVAQLYSRSFLKGGAVFRKDRVEIRYERKECRNIYLVAMLHDVGKIGVQGNIINKPGRLTDEEYDVIKTHTTIGYQILKK